MSGKLARLLLIRNEPCRLIKHVVGKTDYRRMKDLVPSSFNFFVPHCCKTAIMEATPMYVRAEFVPRISQVSGRKGYVLSDGSDWSPLPALPCATTAAHD